MINGIMINILQTRYNDAISAYQYRLYMSVTHLQGRHCDPYLRLSHANDYGI